MSFASRWLSSASEVVTDDQFGREGSGELIAVHVPKNGQFDIGVDPHVLERRLDAGSDLYPVVTGASRVSVGAAVASAIAAQKRQKGGKLRKRTDDTEVVVVLIREGNIVQALRKIAEGAVLHANERNIAHFVTAYQQVCATRPDLGISIVRRIV